MTVTTACPLDKRRASIRTGERPGCRRRIEIIGAHTRHGNTGEAMRQFFDWLGRRNSPHRKPRRQRSRASDRASGLSYETPECRELLTVAVTPVYTVAEKWNSGFQADLRLESHQSASIAPWKLEFDLAANITSIWNANIVSRSGNHYTIVGVAWNKALAANGAVDFGFVASGNGSPLKPTNYLLNGSALGGIAATPGASIGNATLNEGQGGTSFAAFKASLSAPSATPISVHYATSDGTAQAASDYLATSGTLNFAAGETSKTISVAVLGDTQVDGDEAFYVDLSAPVGAQLAQARGSLNRDGQSPSGAIGWVDTTSSSLLQNPYEFFRIFDAITGP
jgi:hypothetical protein